MDDKHDKDEKYAADRQSFSVFRKWNEAEVENFHAFLASKHPGKLGEVIIDAVIEYLASNGIRPSAGLSAAVASVMIKTTMMLIHDKVVHPDDYIKAVVDDAMWKFDKLKGKTPS